MTTMTDTITITDALPLDVLSGLRSNCSAPDDALVQVTRKSNHRFNVAVVRGLSLYGEWRFNAYSGVLTRLS